MVELDIKLPGNVGEGAVKLASKVLTATGANMHCGIKESLTEAHKTIIEAVVKDERFSIEERIDFVNAYEWNVKESRKRNKAFVGPIPFLKKDARPEDIDDNWIVEFFDRVSSVSEKQIDEIWARVLGEKANDPSKFSKRLLQSLFLMEKDDAETFLRLTRFCFYDLANLDSVHPIVFLGKKPETYARRGITDSALTRLQRLDLIDVDFGRGYSVGKRATLRYGSDTVNVEAESVNVGCVRFTDEGKCLYELVAKENESNVFEFTIGLLRSNGCKATVNGVSMSQVLDDTLL